MSIAWRGRLRRSVKAAAAAGIHWSGLDQLAGARHGFKNAPLVVGYHRVVQEYERSDRLSISPMLTSTDAFEKHLDWIEKRYEFVSLDDLALIMEGEKTYSRPVAAITFDDGYQDVYRNAFPILRRRGIPGAVFVVTGLVGTSSIPVHDELHLLLSALCPDGNASGLAWHSILAETGLEIEPAETMCSLLRKCTSSFQATRCILENLGQSDAKRVICSLGRQISIPEHQRQQFMTMDWRMLREMAAGGMTIGSHTKSHVLLATVTADIAREELAGSRRELERHLDTEIKHFAYPDGSFDAATIALVAEAGYRTAHTVCAHRDADHPLLSISRRMLWQNSCKGAFREFSPAVLSCQVSGIFDPAQGCQREHWR